MNETIRQVKIDQLGLQVEALRTMPEGNNLGDGTTRVMLEKRRQRYVNDGIECLENAKNLPLKFWASYENKNLLFHDDFMD